VKDDIDIIAYREENTIRLFGIHKGKPIEKIFKIDEDPWKQQFPMDFEKFVLSQKDSIKFWAIGTDGPAAMKAAKFVASKKERVHVTVNGEKTETVRVRVSIAGLLSFLWYGSSWHRLSDGQYIRFKSVGAPGHPPTILEIVSDN
jgi:hypothetical protein